jgi:SAM-dependent methyltransferase
MCKKSLSMLLMLSISSVMSAASYIDYKKIIDDMYVDVSGYRIPEEEKGSIRKEGGDPTYGEILYESVEFLLDVLKLTPDDVFYDLGCGVGKMVVQVYLTSPAKKSVGIELSDTRCACAQKIIKPITGLYEVCAKAENDIRKKLDKKAVKVSGKKTVKILKQNMLEADISDATAIFICATCFSEELMQQLADKLAGLEEGLRIITLKQFPAHADLKLKETFTLPMTWSKTTPVYMYVLDRSKAEEKIDADELLQGEEMEDDFADLIKS